MHIDKLSAVGRKHLQYIEQDADEEILYEIRKHPIGLVGIYVLGILVTIAIVAATVGLNVLFSNDTAGIGADLQTDLSSFNPLVSVLGGVLAILSLIMTAVGAYLYQSNVVYVTSEKLAQVLYRTLFDRKISQLSIGDVQDVTTNQKGLLAQLFNYGTLVVETAGEQSNYTFNFTPRPYEASRAIVNAHEENLKKFGN